MLEQQPLLGHLRDARRLRSVFIEELKVVFRVVFGNEPDKVGSFRRVQHGGEEHENQTEKQPVHQHQQDLREFDRVTASYQAD